LRPSAVTTTLRQQRAAAGLSQGELADRIGVSRQALSAIEAGRQVPSTALALELAHALHCTVDQLFRLTPGSVVHARLAKLERGNGVTRVVVGRVDGRLVAHPACDETRSADGILFERPEQLERAAVELLSEPSNVDVNVLIAGCAPLLGVLADRLARRYQDARATWVPATSSRSLDLLARRLVHIAGIHLAHAADPDAHVRAAQCVVPHQRSILVNLARWRQGLVVAPGNPRGITTAADLLRPEVRSVVRDAGAGAQKLLERLLRQAGQRDMNPGTQRPLASDHDEVARLVRWGVADVGVAIESAALAEDLDFVPLAEERFDLVIPESYLDTPPVARLLDLLGGPSFRVEAAGLRGYDLSISGHASTVPAL